MDFVQNQPRSARRAASQRTSRHPLATLTGVGVMLFALSAAAVDGVVEVNQATALAGGLTPGDAPGFPVTISERGSYRLTGSLVVPDGTTTAILLAAGSVELDLNGFEISCADPCLGGTGRGIDSVVDLANLRSSVRNGRITGMGGTGVNLLGLGTVEDLVVTNNGGEGITALDHVIVRGCTVTDNAGNGIRVSGGSRVLDNIVARNAGDGIFAEFGSVVSGNTVTDSTLEGIHCTSHCTVLDNSVLRNGVGVVASGLVRANTISQNSSFGIDGTGLTGFADNVLTQNNGNALQVNGGNNLGGNLCSGGGCP